MDSKKNSNYVKIAKWAVDRKNHFFYAFVVFLTVIAIGVRIFPKLKQKKAENFFQLKNSLAKDTSSKDLEKMCSKTENITLNPSLQGITAQKLLVENNKKGIAFAKKAISRTKKDAKYYSTFSEITISISKNDFKNALKFSEKLKKDLEKDKKNEILVNLYNLNLLQKALLEKSLNKDKQELETIAEIEKNKNFSLIEGKSLASFLKNRKEELSKK